MYTCIPSLHWQWKIWILSFLIVLLSWTIPQYIIQSISTPSPNLSLLRCSFHTKPELLSHTDAFCPAQALTPIAGHTSRCCLQSVQIHTPSHTILAISLGLWLPKLGPLSAQMLPSNYFGSDTSLWTTYLLLLKHRWPPYSAPTLQWL